MTRIRLRRWLVAMIAGLTVLGGVVAGPATAADSPIGRIGDTLRVEYEGLVVDVTVHRVLPSPVPPGFGYPPRPPRHEVWRADVTVHPIRVPMAHLLSTVFSFRGVTPTGDAYEPRNTDAPDDLRLALLNAPAGSTVSGGVWWDCYRDLVSNVVLIDRTTGFHLAQWNL